MLKVTLISTKKLISKVQELQKLYYLIQLLILIQDKLQELFKRLIKNKENLQRMMVYNLKSIN